MAHERFQIIGHVVDRGSRRPVQGLRVEAWDRDVKHNDLLGIDTTDSAGRFDIEFDETYFADHPRDARPDVFFRVYRGKQLLTDTRDSVMRNMPVGVTEVTLEVELPAREPPRPDRVTATQVRQGTDWLRRSDFAAAGREARSRGSVIGSLLGEALRSRLADLSPLQAPKVRVGSVVGQDVQAAQTRLREQDVQVRDVKTFDARAVKPIDALRAGVLRPKPGEQYDIYEQDGKVRFIQPVRAEEPALEEVRPAVGELNREVARIKLEVQQIEASREEVKQELSAVRAESAAKDQQIAQLTQELGKLRTEQTKLMERFSPDRIERLELDVKRLRDITGGGG